MRRGLQDREEHLRHKLTGLIDELKLSRRSSDSLVVNSGNEVLCFKLREIDWIESAGNYVCLHAGGVTHIVDETMHGLEKRLVARNFIRIHRSWIVNCDRIRKISPLHYGDHVVELHDGTKLTLSRSYRSAVLDKIKDE